MIARPIGLALLLLAGGPALAADPAAIVEDTDGPVTGVEPMDYVPAGAIIRLGAGGTVTLGYLKSCVHEVVRGGTVTIGAESSQVAGGQVQRGRVECDGGKLILTAAQAAQSGVIAFRRPPKHAGEAGPAVTLYGSSPIVTAPAAGPLRIDRLDRAAPPLILTLVAAPGRRGATADLAKAGQALDPGGLYRLSAGSRDVVVKVAPAARPGTTPLLGRLVRL